MSNRYIFPCQIIDLYKQPVNDKHLQWMINTHNPSKLFSATLTLFQNDCPLSHSTRDLRPLSLAWLLVYSIEITEF